MTDHTLNWSCYTSCYTIASIESFSIQENYSQFTHTEVSQNVLKFYYMQIGYFWDSFCILTKSESNFTSTFEAIQRQKMSTSTPLKFHSSIWRKKIDLPTASCCHSWTTDRNQIPSSVSALHFYLAQDSFKWQVLHRSSPQVLKQSAVVTRP